MLRWEQTSCMTELTGGENAIKKRRYEHLMRLRLFLFFGTGCRSVSKWVGWFLARHVFWQGWSPSVWTPTVFCFSLSNLMSLFLPLSFTLYIFVTSWTGTATVREKKKNTFQLWSLIHSATQGHWAKGWCTTGQSVCWMLCRDAWACGLNSTCYFMRGGTFCGSCFNFDITVFSYSISHSVQCHWL